jgi:tRNAThr (cytosine32-N3)-methyltransferase
MFTGARAIPSQMTTRTIEAEEEGESEATDGVLFSPELKASVDISPGFTKPNATISSTQSGPSVTSSIKLGAEPNPVIHPNLLTPGGLASCLPHPLFVGEQLGVDRRLIVNRKRQLKMYRVWMQGRFRKL